MRPGFPPSLAAAAVRQTAPPTATPGGRGHTPLVPRYQQPASTVPPHSNRGGRCGALSDTLRVYPV